MNDQDISLAVAKKLWPDGDWSKHNGEVYDCDNDRWFDYTTNEAGFAMAMHLASPSCDAYTHGMDEARTTSVRLCSLLGGDNPNLASAKAIMEMKDE